MILKNCSERLMSGGNLSTQDCQVVFAALLDPTCNPLQKAAFLVLLRAKPETAEELSAFVQILRDKMVVVPTQHPVLDIVGTGGDGLQTVNISTGSALLAASCGVKVAKHGNRSVSSLSGSADVLEALGVNIYLSPKQISQSIDKLGIGFCYAPNFHPSLQALREFRLALNMPTIFNLLGPLLNPAKASHLVLGVSQADLVPRMADVLSLSTSERCVVVHGMGLDEISCVGPAKIIEICGQERIEYTLEPLDFGFSRCHIAALRGGNAQFNAQILRDSLQGKTGPIAETLILNAAVALYVDGLHASIKEAVAHASDSLYSGAALVLLNQWVEYSND